MMPELAALVVLMFDDPADPRIPAFKAMIERAARAQLERSLEELEATAFGRKMPPGPHGDGRPN